MYAAYGLKKDRDEVEKFLGYVPASFFEEFSEPEKWSIKIIDIPSGDNRVGRAFGRAFFFRVTDLLASKKEIYKYMGL